MEIDTADNSIPNPNNMGRANIRLPTEIYTRGTSVTVGTVAGLVVVLSNSIAKRKISLDFFTKYVSYLSIYLFIPISIVGYFHGMGELKRFNGDTYTGDFKFDQFDGFGSFLYRTGEKYEGEYNQGERDGHGKYTYTNGNSFEGEFRKVNYLTDKPIHRANQNPTPSLSFGYSIS